MTSIIIATSMIVVAFDTLLLILFLYLAIAAIRLVFRKNYKGAAKYWEASWLWLWCLP